MSFAIMRIEKLKAGNISGCQKHNERENENYSNEDINRDLSHLNYNLIECNSYKEAINKQIEERYLSMRSIRKDAVVGVEVLFTSDNEFFKNLTEEEEKKYFEKSLEFLKDFVGEKNVISATVHKDEKTPHMHCVFTPIDENGKLKFKSFINGRNDLIKMQDNYHKFISQDFDLERGKSVKETQKKHLSVMEFKLETAINERELELEKVTENTQEIKTKNTDLEVKKIELDNQQKIINLTLKELEESEKKIKKEKEKKEEIFNKLADEKTRLYYVNSILEHKKESKGLLSKETTVSLKKELFDSLVQLAVQGEKNIDEFNKLEKTNKSLNENLKKLENNVSELTKNNSILSKQNSKLLSEKSELSNQMNVIQMNQKKYIKNSEEKEQEKNNYIDKLEKALPKEKVEEIKNNMEKEKEEKLWKSRVGRGFGIGD